MYIYSNLEPFNSHILLRRNYLWLKPEPLLHVKTDYFFKKQHI